MTLKLETRARTRRLSSCCIHPSEPVTGFCASCLRERLAGLDPSCDPDQSSSSVFLYSLKSGAGADGAKGRIRATSSSTSLMELRRCKSVSAGKCEGFAGAPEPRRMSCDDRTRNTLAHLFYEDDEKCGLDGESKVESKNIGFSRIADSVFEPREKDENGGEIRVPVRGLASNLDVDDEVGGEVKTMKEHIDLEWQSKKNKSRELRDIAGGFLVAASVFSNKLQKWRQKQKMRRRGGGNGSSIGGGDDGSSTVRVEKMNMRKLRETQLEVGDCGLGRRSCDTEPRFSVDTGRISVDDLRLPFDEPRASWDGYLIARTIPRLTPMLSAVEHAMLAPIGRSDTHRISVDGQMHSIIEDETTSGGSGNDCSESSSSHRRSSFDCSSSIKSSRKKLSVSELEEMKSRSNSNASPTKIDNFPGTKLVITERELKDWHLNSLKDIHLEKIGSQLNGAPPVVNGMDPNGLKRSSKWKKMCNMWGLRQKFTDKYEDHIELTIEPPVTEVCVKQGREGDRMLRDAAKEKLMRSSSCASSRNSFELISSYPNTRSAADNQRYAKKAEEEEFVLEQSKSGRHSECNFDNGLLRFYLTPSRSHKRSVYAKTRPKHSHSTARNFYGPLA